MSVLKSIAIGRVTPVITYQIMPLREFKRSRGAFDLIYSQAAIEHIWFIDDFWVSMAILTAPCGWCSHRIDLADHGRRETNYIEMLQWSEWAYWTTQRFIPGSLYRWRASDHIKKLELMGFQVLQCERELREVVPIPLAMLSKNYRMLDEVDLRTTGLDLIARKKDR